MQLSRLQRVPLGHHIGHAARICVEVSEGRWEGAKLSLPGWTLLDGWMCLDLFLDPWMIGHDKFVLVGVLDLLNQTERVMPEWPFIQM